jgi:hypothetical protein
MAVLAARGRHADRRLREACRDARAAAEALDGLLARWYKQTNTLFHEIMVTSGCHQHKRMWRKRRMTPQEHAEAKKRIDAFHDRIAAGDPSLYQSTKSLFDGAREEAVQVWGGDLAGRVAEGLIDRLAGKHLFKREAIVRKMKQVQADLLGPDHTPIERLLAERAGVCWLAMYEADLASQKFGPLSGVKFAKYFELRHLRSQRLFLDAVKALAVYRKLALPRRPPVVDFGGRLAGVAAARRN